MSDQDRTKWNERFAAGSHTGSEASPFLKSLENQLPRKGRALDIAGGAGRNALWLARRGLDVTIADASEVGLRIAAERAAEENLSLTTLAIDLETDPFPAGPWDLIVQFMFLQRPLFAKFHEALAPGGLLLMLQPTVTNLERRSKPPRWVLLEVGEARSLLSDFEILHYDESWSDDNYHEARVLARCR